MKTLRFLFVFLCVFISSVSAFSYDFKVDGIAYEIISNDGQTVKVVKDIFCFYSGDINIPDFVRKDNKEYKVVGIGNDAFGECFDLTSVTIPKYVTTIGENAFYGCNKLISIIIPENVAYIEKDAFNSCLGLTSIILPESVLSIGKTAFENCRNLVSVTISEGVTSIENSAFRSCVSLTSITIPESVISIGFYAFSSCPSLTSIYLKWRKPISGSDNIFYISGFNDKDLYETATLYIPEGTLAEYQKVEPWCLFKNIQSCSSIDSVQDNGGLYYCMEDETLYTGGKDISLRIYNANGGEVLEVHNSECVSISEFDPGIYIVVTEDGKCFKFIK